MKHLISYGAVFVLVFLLSGSIAAVVPPALAGLAIATAITGAIAAINYLQAYHGDQVAHDE